MSRLLRFLLRVLLRLLAGFLRVVLRLLAGLRVDGRFFAVPPRVARDLALVRLVVLFFRVEVDFFFWAIAQMFLCKPL